MRSTCRCIGPIIFSGRLQVRSPEMRKLLALLVLCLAASFVDAWAATPVVPDQAVTLDTGSGVLHGSLMLPDGAAPMPVVLLIAGSGPTDRNGNTRGVLGTNDSLKLLAEALAASGIASVRYDKRGVGESQPAGPRESDLRFETYVTDAAAWISELRGDRRFSSVTVIGHSEGSLIGMLAVQRSGADAFISIAGLARRGSDVLREQLRLKLDGELAERNEQILVSLERGQPIEPVPPELIFLYRPSVQPYFISWFRYTPEAEIKKLSVPVLIVQGTTDIQVGPADARALKKSRPEAELRIVEGMNHVLKTVSDELAAQHASYIVPTYPVAPELIESIRAFVRAIRAR